MKISRRSEEREYLRSRVSPQGTIVKVSKLLIHEREEYAGKKGKKFLTDYGFVDLDKGLSFHYTNEVAPNWMLSHAQSIKSPQECVKQSYD
jgi:hypothetical protein